MQKMGKGEQILNKNIFSGKMWNLIRHFWHTFSETQSYQRFQRIIRYCIIYKTEPHACCSKGFMGLDTERNEG